jgi:hypothetical protein
MGQATTLELTDVGTITLTVKTRLCSRIKLRTRWQVLRICYHRVAATAGSG